MKSLPGRPILGIFLTTFLLSLYVYPAGQKPAFELTRQMFSETKKIKSLKYTMKKRERIRDQMREQVSSIKLYRHPFKVYAKQQAPNEGLEILFCDGDHNNKALINPAGFPWITLKLDPMGKLMRNDHHHTLYSSGYDHFISILEHLFAKYGEEVPQMVRELEPVIWDGIPCYAIEFRNPHFKYLEHTIKEGETLTKLAEKFHVSAHMILEKNEDIDDYDDGKPGQSIQIPNDYSPRMMIYIDKFRFIPLMVKVYDDRGLYEVYEFYEVTVNASFKPEEFSSDFEEYDF